MREAAATATTALESAPSRKMVSSRTAPVECTSESASRRTASSRPGSLPDSTKASAQRTATG